VGIRPVGAGTLCVLCIGCSWHGEWVCSLDEKHKRVMGKHLVAKWTSSLLEKLHSYFPKAGISVLVRKGNESIYHNHPFLKEVLVWNKQENKLVIAHRLMYYMKILLFFKIWNLLQW
jgi:hypothetical protein